MLILVVLLAAIPVLLSEAQTPKPVAAPLTRVQVVSLLAGDVPSSRVTILVQQRGISFTSNDAFLDQVRKAGGEDDLIAALKAAPPAKNASVLPPPAVAGSTLPPTGAPTPSTPAPNVQLDETKQEELTQHAERGAELMRGNHFAEAEEEYRAAVKVDPDNASLHIALSRALNAQKKSDEGMQEAREAIRLNPESDLAYFILGNALRLQEDWAGAERQYREAIRLNPDFDMSHNNLGFTLSQEGKPDAAIDEYHEALRLNPREELARSNLANALESKGDLDGAITELQTLARQRPMMGGPHFRMAQLMEKNHEPRKALRQYRMATDLAPENQQFKEAYERARHSTNP
jgi:tetratricopeptide (TPR) repeat protein